VNKKFMEASVFYPVGLGFPEKSHRRAGKQVGAFAACLRSPAH
jgi:hypothetical protein